MLRVARSREPGVSVEQIAKDFLVHGITLFKWMRQADAVFAVAERSDSLAEWARQALA